jgi:hypothetical protein
MTTTFSPTDLAHTAEQRRTLEAEERRAVFGRWIDTQGEYPCNRRRGPYVGLYVRTDGRYTALRVSLTGGILNRVTGD